MPKNRSSIPCAGVLAVAGALLAWEASGQHANAQAPYRRYTSPSGPTITPYLEYFRTDTGAVGDPYNAFIAPHRQLNSRLSELSQRQQADFDSNQQQISQLRRSVAAPTGIGGTFMNFSHYYRPFLPTGPVKKR
jgi:hypothetical protein